MINRVMAAVVAAFALIGAAQAQVVREEIYFISDDGRAYEKYSGLRTGFSGYNIYFEKGATLDDYLYFFPNEFSWDRTSDADNDIIRLQQGDYSAILGGAFGDELTIADNGDFVFTSHPNGDPDGDRYGYWNSPQNFSKFVYAWVMPDTLEVVDAKSNRDGEWVTRNNTIAWFGSDTNNVSFSIRFRAKTADTFRALDAAVGENAGVSLDQTGEGVRLTLADTILFPSGSAELSANGKTVVANLADAIDFKVGLTAVVEGHTDNVPISGALAETFPTNWELSAARALAVVRAMEATGAPGPQLEARAYGEHRPVADNATAAGRAANRRISILIIDG